MACKYLSISATSILSEQLFSDMENQITFKKICLASEIVNKLLFVK